MSLSAADVPVYTDLAGLDALKRGAARQDPAAIRKVAQQFEAMFTRMMLKSMRDASGPDPMFGSTQQQTYQEMADDQLSVQLARGRGLGLAEMLVHQLQKMGVPGAAAAAGGSAGSPGISAHPAGAPASGAGAAAYSAAAGASPTLRQNAVPLSSVTERGNFVRSLWPKASEAARHLGVDPRNLLAQAALETNWGRNVPQLAGRSSHNLFGVKASADWSGPVVSAMTHEFSAGMASSSAAPFRVYGSANDSFQDYVALLRGNRRYAGALNTGSDAQAFGAALQRGGYATDPDYARKIQLLAQHVTAALGAGVTELKSAAGAPLTPGHGTLSRL